MTTAAPFLIVAIDGGAASGKSSTSRALSERFHLLHVDTGSHYRFVTHQLLERSVSPENESAVAAALAALPLSQRLVGRSSVIDAWAASRRHIRPAPATTYHSSSTLRCARRCSGVTKRSATGKAWLRR